MPIAFTPARIPTATQVLNGRELSGRKSGRHPSHTRVGAITTTEAEFARRSESAGRNSSGVSVPRLSRSCYRAFQTLTDIHAMTALPAPIPKSDFLPRKAVLLAALFAFCAVASGADPVAPVVWDVAALAKPPAVHATEERPVKGMRALFYEGADYKGKPTWVFAYYAAPAGEPPEGGWPAVVCAHGGGGMGEEVEPKRLCGHRHGSGRSSAGRACAWLGRQRSGRCRTRERRAGAHRLVWRPRPARQGAVVLSRGGRCYSRQLVVALVSGDQSEEDRPHGYFVGRDGCEHRGGR